MTGGSSMKTSSYRSDPLDWPRTKHLLKLGIFAALLVLTGDMLLVAIKKGGSKK